ncbi:proline-rich protein HaeIII subfamily 1-like [Moschus berezovskii]|uniref:proline-rich protein HaeIII subfamily 1-like n=1 Tax=Moschus berezovskii TaxID=68408 RepID=UPI0024449690|nr:proline-rich protein HaeIII subfamily 1-like [Moschus berezovskii]
MRLPTPSPSPFLPVPGGSSSVTAGVAGSELGPGAQADSVGFGSLQPGRDLGLGVGGIPEAASGQDSQPRPPLSCLEVRDSPQERVSSRVPPVGSPSSRQRASEPGPGPPSLRLSLNRGLSVRSGQEGRSRWCPPIPLLRHSDRLERRPGLCGPRYRVGVGGPLVEAPQRLPLPATTQDPGLPPTVCISLPAPMPCPVARPVHSWGAGQRLGLPAGLPAGLSAALETLEEPLWGDVGMRKAGGLAR